MATTRTKMRKRETTAGAVAALKRADRKSKRDGRLRYVYANYNGYQITLRRPIGQGVLWTNGEHAGFWAQDACEGVRRPQYESFLRLKA